MPDTTRTGPDINTNSDGPQFGMEDVLATLWRRATELMEEVATRDREHDEAAWLETTMRLRTIALLIASMAAVSPREVGRKAILVASLRDTAGHCPSWTVAMIEAAITATWPHSNPLHRGDDRAIVA